MIIDLSPILRGEVSTVKIEYEMSETPDVPDVTFTEGCRVSGKVDNRAGYMTLSLHASLPYVSSCARCLEDIFGTFTLTFNRTVAASGTLQNEANDDYVIVKNGKLDIDRELVEDLMLEFPAKLLCKEECAGICPKCGKSLNFGECGCPKKKEIDPRLAILQKLLEND